MKNIMICNSKFGHEKKSIGDSQKVNFSLSF